MERKRPAHLSGRIGEITVLENRFIPGEWFVVQETPESADACFDWRYLDQDLSQEQAERRKEEYLSGKRPIPPWR